jgi:DNA-binding Lrp family transcriptional regulator
VNQEKLALLFALQEQPIAPAAKLAKAAAAKLNKEVPITPPTARAWLESFKEEKVYGGIQSNLRVHRLGLEMYDFFVGVDEYDSLRNIETFCEEHPYTSYRARVFGGTTNGMLLQFRQPIAANEHLQKAFYKMMKANLITSIRELPTLQTIFGSTYTRPRLEAWNPEKMGWEFDWEKWWRKAPKKSKDVHSGTVEEKDRIDLDALDAKLLQEMTMNARRKNVDIIRAVGLNPDEKGVQQNVSTRLSRLKNEVVESYRVYINWDHFDIYNTPLVVAKADSKMTRQLISHLKDSEFPFSSSIRETQEGFVWSARLPSAHLSELVSLVWRVAESHELLIIDYKHSQWYGLWAEAFDGEKKDWRTEKEFCHDGPLGKIGL